MHALYSVASLWAVWDGVTMMDRRSLLKRFGLAGLVVPAAVLVERHLVLPSGARAEALSEAAQVAQRPVMARESVMYVTSIDINQMYRPYDMTTILDVGRRYMPGPAELHMTIELVGQEQMMIDAFDALERRQDPVRVTLLDAPFRSLRITEA